MRGKACMTVRNRRIDETRCRHTRILVQARYGRARAQPKFASDAINCEFSGVDPAGSLTLFLLYAGKICAYPSEPSASLASALLTSPSHWRAWLV